MYAKRLFVLAVACASFLSGCLVFMGPADPVVRVTGSVDSSVQGLCTLRVVDATSGKNLYEGDVAGNFEIAFSYTGSYRDKKVDFDLSCGTGPWVTVVRGAGLPSPRGAHGPILLGTISQEKLVKSANSGSD